jgi:hypothetical protein
MSQEITVVIAPQEDGSIEVGFFAQDGTYEQGVENINALLAQIAADGAQIVDRSQVENHRLQDDEVMNRLHDVTHEHLHSHRH